MAEQLKPVLVVDDDLDLRGVVEFALCGAGYRVITAADGREALRQLKRELPGLILLDMKMAGMGGCEFARVLRARHGRCVPIVVLTAAHNAGQRAEEIGADGYLDKPFRMRMLRELVEHYLDPRGEIHG